MSDEVFAFRDHRTSAGGRRIDVAFTDARTNLRGTAPGYREQMRAVESACGVPLMSSSQVHGDDVTEVFGRDVWPGGRRPVTSDALLTREPGVALMTRAADCVPLVMADVEAGLVAAVHSGRPGTALGITLRAAEAMRDAGAERLVAWIGPHVCGGCYEVPAQLRDEVAALVPETYAETRWGTPALDIGAGVRAQLAAAGVEAIEAGGCTVEDLGLHSHRRDADAAGRLAGLIWMSP